MTRQTTSLRSPRRLTRLVLATALLLWATGPALDAAAHAATTWDGGNGDWRDDARWTPATAPNATDVDVEIDGGKTGTDSTVTLDMNADVLSLTVDAGDALGIANGSLLDVNGGGVANDGQITLDALGTSTAGTYLYFRGNQSLTGTGEVVLSDDPQNIVRPATDADTLTHETGHTIRGAGKLLQNLGGMINQGTILAEGGYALVIDPGSPGFTNQGTLRAVGTGGLRLQNGSVNNFGETIEVADGSVLDLDNVDLVGGTLAATGAGTGQVLAGNGCDFDAVTVDAGTTVDQANGDIVNIYNGLANEGTWNLNSIGASTAGTYLRFQGSQTLGGAGKVVMTDDPNNALYNGADDQTLTLGADHTIRGAGQLVKNIGGMINQGTILAEGAHPLLIDPGTPGFTNQGTLRAIGPGGLRLQNGAFLNMGATVEVADGSVLDLRNAGLVGGHLAALGAGTGQILAGNGCDFDAVTVDAGTTVDQANGDIVDIVGGLVNEGTWNLNATGGSSAGTYLRFQGSQTLGGSGKVVLSDDPNNGVYPSADAEVIAHAAGHTLRGAGQLLLNIGGMINQGTILAEGTYPLLINPGTPGFTNQGTLRAVGAGGLRLLSGDFTNTGHTIEVADGSVLDLDNAGLVGGHLAATGAGTGQILAGNGCDFDAVTVDADTTVDQANGDIVDIVGGLVNEGTWNLNATGGSSAWTYLRFQGSQTLGGAGKVVLSDDPNNAVRVSADDEILTHAAGHTLRGAGALLSNVGGMVNHGTIIADGGYALTVNPGSGGFTTDGLIEVVAGSRLTSNGTLTQTAGTTRVDGELSVNTLLDIQGGVLTGTGTITGQANVAGTFAPGESVGTLTFDLLEILEGASYDFEIQGSVSDLIHVSDTFVMDKDGPYSIDVICSGGVACLGEHDFFTWVGDDPIDWKDWALLYQNTAISFSPGYDGDWSYDETANRMYIEITQTPEPATLALLALGGLGLLGRRRHT